MYTKIILIRSIKINERYRNKREYTISDRHVLATLSLSHRESKGDIGTLDIQSHGLQIRRQDDGWSIDWPEIESYEIGPSSIAWIMWHIIYWWRTTLDYNFGDGT